MPLQYFGFLEDPFGATPDPRYLYSSHTHREALASIEYGFKSNRGFTAIIAPPGMGKTTLLFRFLEDVRETACSVFLFDIDYECEPREFVAQILRELGISPARSSSEMHEQLSESLLKETRAGRKCVFVIDEAQNLSDAVLERVRLLTNFETSRGKLMHIVLSGQPQLSDKLLQPSLLQLRQRISTICRLEPLSPEETASYINYRVKQAGYDGEPLFTDDALRLISDASQGTPRNINNLCFNALSLCRALNSRQVDADMMTEVIADLKLSPQSQETIAIKQNLEAHNSRELKTQKAARILPRWVLTTTALTIMCLLSVFLFTELRFLHTHNATEVHPLNLQVSPEAARSETTSALREADADKSTPKSKPIAITIEQNQKLQDISKLYLGGYDRQRLQQIQALNPRLTNPDHIEAGQRIWLPASSSNTAAKIKTPPASERNIP